MVRGIDIQNVVANTQFVTREQQINQQQANFAPAHASQEGQKDEDLNKERVQQSQQSEQEHKTIDSRRRHTSVQRRGRRRRRGTGPPVPKPRQAETDLEEPSSSPREKGHIIDLEA